MRPALVFRGLIVRITRLIGIGSRRRIRGETLKTVPRIHFSLHRIANYFDEIILTKSYAAVSPDCFDKCCFVTDAEIAIQPCLHRLQW